MLLRSLAVGTASRFRSLFAPQGLTPAIAVRRFYEQARGNEEQYEIIDLGQGAYRGLLEGLSSDAPPFRARDARVLDLGCGDLHLLHHLCQTSARPARYHGIDILPPSVASSRLLNEDLTFQSGDLGNLQVNCPFAANLAITCNALCYVQHPQNILRQAAENLTVGGYAIVIEPIPSLFWENYFNGIHLHFRPRGSFNAFLAELGVAHKGDYILYAVRIFGRPCWPVAYLSIFAKQ